MDIIKDLQEHVAPDIFAPRCVYDGRNNLFSVHRLPFGDQRSRTVSVHTLKYVAQNLLVQSLRSPSILLHLPQMTNERQGFSGLYLQKLQRST